MQNLAWAKELLVWIGFLLITVGVILVVKHFTLDTRLGDLNEKGARRWKRLGLYCLVLAAGLVAQRLAEAL